MSKPDALALADAIDPVNKASALVLTIHVSQAAAELRRLHAENEALKAEASEQCRIIGGSAETELRLRAENEALRVALRNLLAKNERFSGGVWDAARKAMRSAMKEQA